MSFTSHHTPDNPKPKIDLEIIEDDEDITSEFNGFPVMLTIDQTTHWLRKTEAETIFTLLASALRDIDRKVIDKTLDPKKYE